MDLKRLVLLPSRPRHTVLAITGQTPAAGRPVQLQEMGFGLAAAILLDATVVRSILVPTAMELFGGRIWHLRCWLRWLADLPIEGQPATWP